MPNYSWQEILAQVSVFYNIPLVHNSILLVLALWIGSFTLQSITKMFAGESDPNTMELDGKSYTRMNNGKYKLKDGDLVATNEWWEETPEEEESEEPVGTYQEGYDDGYNDATATA